MCITSIYFLNLSAVLRNAIKQRNGCGTNTGMNGDSTHNHIRNGYARLSFGCHTIKKTGECSHKFRPFAFMLTRTERGDAYHAMFSSTDKFLDKYENGFKIIMATFTSDHHDGLIGVVATLDEGMFLYQLHKIFHCTNTLKLLILHTILVSRLLSLII
jgi:hypothetical protein